MSRTRTPLSTIALAAVLALASTGCQDSGGDGNEPPKPRYDSSALTPAEKRFMDVMWEVGNRDTLQKATAQEIAASPRYYAIQCMSDAQQRAKFVDENDRDPKLTPEQRVKLLESFERDLCANTAAGDPEKAAPDAAQDVELGKPEITTKYSMTEMKIPLTVTNHSSKKSNYSVELEWVDAEGTRVHNETAYIENVRPTQATKKNQDVYAEEAVMEKIKDLPVKISGVKRTESF
ncbi:hypothetical protein [Streptomyces sp. NBC_01244]|uniref:hypothetical protein n=1 Tax=Streptomyces sp. NBC_01244 TaxID=2903797 RepID=UPI002E0ED885|nr:hypothetical protein OG247_33020 [Streptomyces sp. NBC_01244]